MHQGRIHRAISFDGTEIAGRVAGTGPPLVLVHGGVDDGETSWGLLLPRLTDHFTCYLPSTRDRGLSGEHPDHRPERLVEDVTAFVESIGEPVGLLGESSGAELALGTAARSRSVAGVVAYEPPVPEVLGEEDAERFDAVVRRMSELVEAGRSADAARVFMEAITRSEEMAALSGTSYLEDIARYTPTLLQEIRQQKEAEEPGPTDPGTLARITAPVLLLFGSDTGMRWFVDGVHYAARHIPEAEVRELPGLGHAGPALGVEPAAQEVVQFVGRVLQAV